MLVIIKVHHTKIIMRCHIRLLWSSEFSDASRAFHLCSFKLKLIHEMLVKTHDWQLDREYPLPTDVMRMFTFFETNDIFPLAEA